MKSFKSFVTLSSLALVGTLVVSCGGTPVSSSSEVSSSISSSVEVVVMKDVSVGLGLIVSADLIKDSTGLKQVNVTGASASFDEAGKVISVEFDVMQIPVVVVEGAVALKADAKQVKDAGDKVVETKQELTTRYGMLTNSAIHKEAYEQLRAFADFAKGKTIAEIEAHGYIDGYPSQEEGKPLAGSVSVNVTDYINALTEAFETKKAAVEVENDAVLNTGLGMTVAVASNKITVTASNITVDAENTIQGAVVDMLEIPFTVTEGLISLTATAKQVKDAGVKVIETKKELGERYNMNGAAGEWYEQAAAYENWLVGKPTTTLDFTGTNFETGHELVASVTISVDAFFATAKEAAVYAKALPVPPAA